jgi:hypothetical protein
LGLAGPCAQHVETHTKTRSAVRTCNIPAPRKIFARQFYLKRQLAQIKQDLALFKAGPKWNETSQLPLHVPQL